MFQQSSADAVTMKIRVDAYLPYKEGIGVVWVGMTIQNRLFIVFLATKQYLSNCVQAGGSNSRLRSRTFRN